MFARVTAVLIACGASIFAADPGLMSLVMPDAISLAGLNAAQAKSSPLGQFVLSRIAPDNQALQALLAQTGFDPRRDVQEILVASNHPMRPSLNVSRGLVLVRGNFDVGRITQAALSQKATLTQYDGVPILSGPDAKGAVAFPDATLAIAGEPADVRAALDRRSSPMPMNAKLASGAQALSAANDVWAISEGPMVPPELVNPQMALFSKVEQSTWGVKFGSDIAVTAQATMPTAQDAAALAQALQFIAGMGDIYVHDTYLRTTLMQNLKVTANGNLAQASLAVPEASLEQLFFAPHAPAPKP